MSTDDTFDANSINRERDGLSIALKLSRELEQRLPVRVPGCPTPMVPVSMEDLKKRLPSHVDYWSQRSRKPLVLRTMEEDLDAALAAIHPDELDKREPVEIPGYPAPMVLLTAGERWRLVQVLMQLTHRVQSLGDMRSLKQLVDQSREGHSVVSRVVVAMAVDIEGFDKATEDMIDEIIRRLEHTNEQIHHENAAILRKARQRWRKRPTGMH